MGIEFHPLSKIFPLIEGEEFDALVADIRDHGIREPIWLYEGQIIDGRNRYRASEIAGADCPMREYLGDDPAAFVVSLNLKRRHLSESQRAMVAAKLANVGAGRNWANLPDKTTNAQASDLLNVSERSVKAAKRVQSVGAPELVTAVERGSVSVSAAADIATKPQEEQREIVARGEKQILEAAKAIRAEKSAARRDERVQKLVEISNANAPLMAERKYPVIYADPPWRFETFSDVTGMDKSADNHYPTMTLDELKALPVSDIATPDAALFLWATVPMLPEALETIAAWGFKYKSHQIWAKDRAGTGYWFRNKHELLIVATRGSFPAPLPGSQWESVIEAPVGAHSEKPEAFRAQIEELFPELPKIEMFARKQSDGWQAWGNQSQIAA